MRKTVKIEGELKDRLLSLERPGEDYNDVVQRLLNLYELLSKAEPMIHGAAEYWRLQSGTKQEITAAIGVDHLANAYAAHEDLRKATTPD